MANFNPKLLNRHVFVFNPEDNSGEGLTLMTEYYSSGGPDGIFVNHELTLQSYSNSATFNLSSIGITPESLRRLADELEKIRKQSIDMAQLLVDKPH